MKTISTLLNTLFDDKRFHVLRWKCHRFSVYLYLYFLIKFNIVGTYLQSCRISCNIFVKLYCLTCTDNYWLRECKSDLLIIILLCLVSSFEWFFDFDILNAKKLHILDVDYKAILSIYKKVTWNDTVLVSNAYTND